MIREAPVPGVNAIAAPILDADGAITAAITLIGTVNRLPVARNGNPVLARILEVTRALSAALAGRPAHEREH